MDNIAKTDDNRYTKDVAMLKRIKETTKLSATPLKPSDFGQEQSNVNFFYNVNSSKHYMYTKKYESLDKAKNALQTKDNVAYNAKMSIVKIEN
jgi:hypothetical protein